MKKLLFLILAAFSLSAAAQNKDPEFVKYMHSPWVDSIIKTMSLKDQVAQMIFVELRPGTPETILKAADQVKNLKVGGGVIFASNLAEQARIINGLQASSKVPLLITVDGEWGLGMRFSDVDPFPFQGTLGSLQGDELLYKMGLEVARQAKRAGIHMNLAPTVDVNNNAANPVIGYRSFGSDPKDVAAKGLAYMKGMEAGGILCTAKHYPGHGNTAVDSHLGLPLIPFSKAELDKTELYPFYEVIKNGGTGIMPGHLNVPALTGSNIPSSLSPNALKGILRDSLKYKGLLFTDGMDMRGISNFYSPGEAAIRAVIAGNDVLELVRDPYVAVDSIMLAIKQKRIDPKQIEESARRILAAKYYVGLNKYKPTSVYNIVDDVNNPANNGLITEMAQKSITAVSNLNEALPVKQGAYRSIGVLSLRSRSSKFTDRIKSYFPVKTYTLDYSKTMARPDALADTLKKHDLLIIELGDLNRTPGNPKNAKGAKNPVYQFGITEYARSIIALAAKQQRVILTVFGSPYAIDVIPAVKDVDAVVYAGTDNAVTQDLMAQAVAGAFDIEGKLPVVLESYPLGTSVKVKGGLRFKFTSAEETGIDPVELKEKVDSVMFNAIERGAFPGGEVVIAKDQKVIFQNSYGFHDFTAMTPVKDDDLYDMASNTKIMSALAAYMILFERGKIDLDAPISTYLPKLKFEKSNKKDVTLRSQLSHIAGFQPYYPFYRDAREKKLLSTEPSKKYPVKLDENLWASEKIYNFVYEKIRDLPIAANKGGEVRQLYSCLGFVLAPEIIKNVTGEDYFTFVKREIYDKIGAYNTTFAPLQNGFDKSRLVPTEVDSVFRKKLVHGYTHDEASALLGGRSSNAGLFSDGLGMAKMMQLYLNKGAFAGDTLFSPETFDVFNTAYYTDRGNNRVLGFDKPAFNNDTLSYDKAWPSPSVSKESFGHTGFTGTFTWSDPANGVTIIFLSNRVFPTRNNPEFSHASTSKYIQQIVYDLLAKGRQQKAEKEIQEAEKEPSLFAD